MVQAPDLVQVQELETVQALVADLQAGGHEDQARALEKVLSLAASVLAGGRPAAGPREYLTTGQAAGSLGVSRQTIKNWVQAGRLPGVALGGRTLIHREAVQALLDRLLSARSSPVGAQAADRAAVEGWHTAAVSAVPAARLARLEALHTRLEDGAPLSREERAEMVALERTVTRAATNALERRVHPRRVRERRASPA